MRDRLLSCLRVMAAVAIAAFGSPLLATIPTTALTGRVVVGDAPAAGVEVTVMSTALLQQRTTLTGPRGTYWLQGLPPGLYDVTFSRPGLTSHTRRAMLESGRVARADARLEVSEDEEHVTSTATTFSITDTTTITSNVGTEEMELLPLGRNPRTIARLAPGTVPQPVLIDGAQVMTPAIIAGGPIAEVAVIRGAEPAHHDTRERGVIHARTHSGGEEFSLALRATWERTQNDDGLFVQSSSGGRIVPERLWFFGAGWAGDRPRSHVRDVRGVLFKLTGQLSAAHSVSAMVLDAEGGRTDAEGRPLSQAFVLAHTGAFGPRWTSELRVSRSDSDDILRDEHAAAKLTWFAPTSWGDHVVTGGVSTWDNTPTSRGQEREQTAFFLDDRWSASRWTVSAGLRHTRQENDRDELSPRLSVVYDILGNHRQAVVASYGDYAPLFGRAPERLTTLGFLAAIGTTGSARADYVRRESGGTTFDELQLEARYALFGRLFTGGSYTWSEDDHHRGNAWAAAQLPLGEHEFGVSLLEEYEETTGWDTGIGFRYTMPVRRTRVTFAADGMTEERLVRLWARVRL